MIPTPSGLRWGSSVETGKHTSKAVKLVLFSVENLGKIVCVHVGVRRLWKGGACMLSCFGCVRLFVTQTPLSMGFSRQEHWSRLPCPPPGDLLDPRIKLGSPALQADSLPLSHLGSPLAVESVQFSSVVSNCDPMDCSIPGFPVHHQLPELAQTHVQCWVTKADFCL